MTPELLTALLEWLQERRGKRQAIITLGGYGFSPDSYSINVYDYDLKIGQDIKKIEEIDLVAKKKKHIEALRKKADRLESEVEDYGNPSQESC
jgi:hypothetical protein